MREIPVPRRVEAWRYAKPISLSFLLLGLGIWLGSAFFPVVEIQVVERRIEVPVEVIKSVERVVEKRVEVPVEKVVEKRIEIPVDKVIYREPPEPYYAKYLEPKTDQWLTLRKGMTPSQVRTILGVPIGTKVGGYFEEWFYSKEAGAACVVFFDGTLFHWSPP